MIRLRPIIPIVLLLALGISASSQSREITEAEFARIEQQATKTSFERTYRPKMDSRHLERGEATPSLEITGLFERGAGNANRSLRIEKDAKGTRETETITLGKYIYTRTTGKRWMKQTEEEKRRSDGNRFTISGNPAREEKEFKFFHTGKVQMNGRTVDVYESRKFRRYQLGSGRTHAYTIVERLWIDSDGRLQKRTSRNYEADNHLSIDTSLTYEYPSVIRITAPIK